MLKDSFLLKEYWAQDILQIFKNLGSSPQGLTTQQVDERLRSYGENTITTRKRSTSLDLFLSQFRNPIVLILIFATMVSLIVGEKVEAILIFLIILGSSTLSFFQENNANHATEELKRRVSIQSTVLRDGEYKKIKSEWIVPGDIISLTAGSLIPADGLIIDSNNLQVNQSVLTGETFPVIKSPERVEPSASLSQRTNCVFMGTSVRSGSGAMLAVHTGQNTEFGEISKSLSLRPEKTEFERGIHQFGLMLSQIMLVMVFLVFAVNIYFQKPFIDSLLFSIALAVGLTPQLLPAIISINLSKGAQVMAHQGVIVKKLNAIENFGSMDIFCTDKTGTLTLGSVKLDAAFNVEGDDSDEVSRLAFLNAVFQHGIQNPLDDAIIAKFKYNLEGYTKLGEIPYDFIRKRLSIIYEHQNRKMMVTKGAFENILKVCFAIEAKSETRPLDHRTRLDLRHRFDAWSDQGFRVLAVAVKELSDEQQKNPLHLEKEMIFMGFLLFLTRQKRMLHEPLLNWKKLV